MKRILVLVISIIAYSNLTSQNSFIGFAFSLNDTCKIQTNETFLGKVNVNDTVFVVGNDAVYYYRVFEIIPNTDGMDDYVGGEFLLDDSVIRFTTHFILVQYIFVDFYNNYKFHKESHRFYSSFFNYICYTNSDYPVKLGLNNMERFKNEDIFLDFNDSIAIINKESFIISNSLLFNLNGEQNQNIVCVIQNDYSIYYIFITQNLSDGYVEEKRILISLGRY